MKRKVRLICMRALIWRALGLVPHLWSLVHPTRGPGTAGIGVGIYSSDVLVALSQHEVGKRFLPGCF